MLNRITMTGRLVADPELRRTQSGVSVTSFRIANDRDYGKGEEKETDFFDVVAWRSTAEFICKYFTKGRMISVDGRLQTRGWKDREGNNRVSIEILVDNAYFADSKKDDAAGDFPADDQLRATAPIRALCRAAAMTLRRISNSGKTTRGGGFVLSRAVFLPCKSKYTKIQETMIHELSGTGSRSTDIGERVRPPLETDCPGTGDQRASPACG